MVALICEHGCTARTRAVDVHVAVDVAVAASAHESRLEIMAVPSGTRRIVYRSRAHIEAPNWSRDGATLVFNQEGRLFTLPLAGGPPRALDTGEARRCNNDHGLSPDGKWLALSDQTNGPSRIFIAPAQGGLPRLVTELGPSYWHGWSPDGRSLVYCARRNDAFDIYSIAVEGGHEHRLTNAAGLDDGPDFTPDGAHIYFNSERSGLMKIWRMNADGADQIQITFDAAYADWFPHPSPDARWLIFLSFDHKVVGHPRDQDVVLRLLSLGDETKTPRVLARLFGGQGTINVPSWSPDGHFVAFVSY